MLTRLAYRFATEISPRVGWKVLYLFAYKGMRAVHAYKARLKNKQLFPPFMFIALTNTCNLRCQGCWVEKEGEGHFLPVDDVSKMITEGKKHKAHYYTLLGGEPFMHKGIWDIFSRHQDCYFQVITNGMYFTERHAKRLKELGNVTPLISIDGMEFENDKRRGEGVFQSILKGMELLKREKIFFGMNTTVTSTNADEAMSDEYIQYWIKRGVMYIWYYVYRSVGEDPHPEYCLSKEQLIKVRKRLLELRRKHPLLIIDTYWTASGEAFCPAATGLGFHIGPQGSIEPCPPLSFAVEKIQDNGGDIYNTINNSDFLRGFQKFVKDRTKGCVILEHPQELVEYLQGKGAKDYSGRDAYSEINAITPRHSQHLPGEEIPEDFWFYRFMKNQVFFGMGAAG